MFKYQCNQKDNLKKEKERINFRFRLNISTFLSLQKRIMRFLIASNINRFQRENTFLDSMLIKDSESNTLFKN